VSTDDTDECCQPGCDGTEVYADDEYGSLAEGGSYEVYECNKCGHLCYRQLPD
jgi:hypothetical protein